MSTMQAAADYAEARDAATKADAIADMSRTRLGYRDAATAHAGAAVKAERAGLEKAAAVHSGECRRLTALADACGRSRRGA